MCGEADISMEEEVNWTLCIHVNINSLLIRRTDSSLSGCLPFRGIDFPATDNFID